MNNIFYINAFLNIYDDGKGALHYAKNVRNPIYFENDKIEGLKKLEFIKFCITEKINSILCLFLPLDNFILNKYFKNITINWIILDYILKINLCFFKIISYILIEDHSYRYRKFKNPHGYWKDFMLYNIIFKYKIKYGEDAKKYIKIL